jgi:regulator of cell morphogenesis and NO signaling
MEFRTRTVGDLVAEDYRRSGIFKKHGIDFCCGGGLPLEEACARKKVDVSAVERDLMTSYPSDAPAARFQPDRWAPDFLADYIENVHHTFVRENLPILQAFGDKVARVHGHHNSELIEVAARIHELIAEMTSHMQKEEEIVFPYVRELMAADKQGRAPSAAGFGSVDNPIRVMEEEHEHAGGIMARLREITSDFTPPEHACNTYRALFVKLEEFEEDLHRHVHLENNILFPAAKALEARLSEPVAVEG